MKYSIGLIVLVVANGLATIAGLGGGGIALVIFMIFFDYLPKDATILVLCSILAASTGNISNLMRKSFNGKPLIQYQYVFLIIPIMFTGSFIGILINKYFPSIVICLIILAVISTSIKKTYVRFKANYKR